MAKKTLEQFRAEKGLWRSELAKKLNMSEEELSKLEELNEVPPEIAKKITGEYSLPEDYFTFDPNAKELRYTPKKPFLYFFKVSVIWFVVFSVLSGVISAPLTVATAMNFEVTGLFGYISSVCKTIIIAFSGVYLTSYINRKTSFTKEVRKYDYVYPYLSWKAAAFLSPVSAYFLEKAAKEDSFFGTSYFFTAASGIATLVILSLFCACLLYTAALTKDKKQTLNFALLCGLAVISSAVNIICKVIIEKNFSEISIAETAVSGVLLIAVCAAVIFLDKKLPRLRTLWLTVLPLCAMLTPCVFEAVRLFG
ncbi:MAG: hypothetical protein ACI4KI_04695 [Candidatus Fimenecus sp.]